MIRMFLFHIKCYNCDRTLWSNVHQFVSCDSYFIFMQYKCKTNKINVLHDVRNGFPVLGDGPFLVSQSGFQRVFLSMQLESEHQVKISTK